MIFIIHLMALACVCRPRKNPYRYGVTIIKPISVYNTHLEECIESFCNLNYPNVELSLCLQNVEPGVLDMVTRLVRKYPGIIRVYHNDNTPYVNPKINNILEAWNASTNNFIWIADSDIITTPNNLTNMMSCMTDDVGLVHQVPISRNRSNLVEYVYFATAHYRMYKFLNLLGIPCVSGKSILIRRSTITDLAVFGDYIAEDYKLAEHILKSNMKIVLTENPCYMLNSNSTVTTWYARMVRWSRIRLHLNYLTYLEPILECLMYVILFGSPELMVVWFMFDLYIARTLVDITLLEFAIGWMSRELMYYVIYVVSMMSSTVVWNGKSFTMNRGTTVSGSIIPDDIYVVRTT